MDAHHPPLQRGRWMMGIREKLLLVIGDRSVNQWARDHELPPQTVHAWIEKDRIPRTFNFQILIKSTGIPKEWWLSDDCNLPNNIINYPISTSGPLTTGSGQHTGITAQNHSITDMRVNDFITFPKYDLQSITKEGHDHVIHSEQIVNHLAFKREWLEMSLNASNCLALISVKDDSMEPTLKSDDLILTDTRSGSIENNSIYVLQIDNELIVKRIQRKVNGAVIVKSDNPVYGEEELDALAAKSLPVVGKVVWFGRRI